MFKKICLFFVLALLLILPSGCSKETTTELTTENSTLSEVTTTMNNYYNPKDNTESVVLEDIEKCFYFFWDTMNSDESSAGYGLVPDRYNLLTNKVKSAASIASVGYGLAAIPIGVSHGFISYSEGEERAYKALLNLQKLDKVMGFYYHFYNMETGIKVTGTEVSIIDSSIFLCGALTAGQFFGGRVNEIAQKIYDDVVWPWYYDEDSVEFYMGYSHDDGKFYGHWTSYAEQLMIFILASGSSTHAVGRQPYTLMKGLSATSSKTSDYDSFYMSWTSSLFVYQYSHSFFDSAKYVDSTGYSWFLNSVNASKASYAYAQIQSAKYLTCNENSWGFSACDGPNGYNGSYGSGPSAGGAHQVDGTIALNAAIASIVFTKENSLKAMNYYRSNNKLWSKYGFIDAYNLGTTSSFSNTSITIPSGGWYATDLIGIDKGNELMMLENYHSSLIWNLYTTNANVERGLLVLGFKKVE